MIPGETFATRLEYMGVEGEAFVEDGQRKVRLVGTRDTVSADVPVTRASDEVFEELVKDYLLTLYNIKEMTDTHLSAMHRLIDVTSRKHGYDLMIAFVLGIIVGIAFLWAVS